ncbi:hypothetical protein KK083_19080 [Fulvivirgaceae bacterium PWU4]|uniref:BZIP transcription factor n=1 Tax=Chryseosolibacter histidini TaxID=2782349 RepID=A0AAP2GK61_9BACT|nr:tail fiber protein [Chryseosolibacter histidini]MBT1699006.1 hypothetical protein [Chryseosolibacter histidini]
MKSLLLALTFLFVVSSGAVAQTVTAQYLDPGSDAASYDYMRFVGTTGVAPNITTLYPGGFMYNKSTNLGFGNGDDFTIYTYDGRDMMLRTDGGNVFFNTNRIGLNTYTPNARLHIPNGDIIVGGIEGIQNTINASLMVKSRADNNVTYPFYVGKYGSGTDLFWVRGEGNAYLLGKFGIGTNNPEGQLQIDNANPMMVIGYDEKVTSGQSTLRFYSGVATPTVYANGFDIVYNKTVTTDRLSFMDGGSIEVLTLANGGMVGIGTTTPDAKLTVKGNIHTQEVLIDLAGAVTPPDYVFEENYNLSTLAEVEAYIKANKHLPEVPSASEMLRDGMNVTEMNMLLLKKVEELTLHLIELKKENEKMQERLNKLEKK